MPCTAADYPCWRYTHCPMRSVRLVQPTQEPLPVDQQVGVLSTFFHLDRFCSRCCLVHPGPLRGSVGQTGLACHSCHILCNRLGMISTFESAFHQLWQLSLACCSLPPAQVWWLCDLRSFGWPLSRWVNCCSIKELDAERVDTCLFTSWPLGVTASSIHWSSFVKPLACDADGWLSTSLKAVTPSGQEVNVQVSSSSLSSSLDWHYRLGSLMPWLLSCDSGDLWFTDVCHGDPGFPAFHENKIPWFFPDFSMINLLKFHDNYLTYF